MSVSCHFVSPESYLVTHASHVERGCTSALAFLVNVTDLVFVAFSQMNLQNSVIPRQY